VKVLSYVPSFGEQVACAVTHYESTSLANFLTLKNDQGHVLYRPTVHYAYHACEDALDSIREVEAAGWNPDLHAVKHVYRAEEIQDGGCDELGVLMCTKYPKDGTYWYGTTVYSEEAKAVAPYSTATSVQVAAGVLSGALWMQRNPTQGLCEPENIIDYEQVLHDAAPFLGKLHLGRSSWTPRGGDPTNEATWQFNNLRVSGSSYDPRSTRIFKWSDKGSW